MRYYGLRMPDCVRVEPGGFLLRLLGGLAGMDGSLYREWLQTHGEKPPSADNPDAKDDVRLSYHCWNQNTMIALSIRNMMEQLIYAHSDGKHKPKPWLPPDSPKRKQVVEADYESMMAMLTAAANRR